MALVRRVFLLLLVVSSISQAGAPDAPWKFATTYDKADFSKVTETVKELNALQELFIYIRDERFLIWEKMPNFPRRIPWLYTDNGCSDRATLVRQLFEKKKLPAPTRIFVFSPPGKRLQVTSPYWTKPIYWGEYHTAIITKVNGKNYVIDPVANFERPLLLEEWLALLSDEKKEELSMVVCNSLSSTAERSCFEKDPKEADSRVIAQLLLEKEWEAVTELAPQFSHDPNVVLGDSPPWKKKANSDGKILYDE